MFRFVVPSLGVALALATTAACRSDDSPATRESSSGTSGSAPAVAAQGSNERGLRIVHAAPGDVAASVLQELAATKAKHRDLVVYVGATWCEPCQRFHAAAERGELDAAFPTLTMLEFDLDQDRERLVAAGYQSQFIPLFALPGPDGRSTGKQIEGSVKGSSAVAEISPRLKALIGK